LYFFTLIVGGENIFLPEKGKKEKTLIGALAKKKKS